MLPDDNGNMVKNVLKIFKNKGVQPQIFHWQLVYLLGVQILFKLIFKYYSIRWVLFEVARP